MNGLLHWLTSGLLYGTALFALAWVLSVTVLKAAHPATRALLFGLVLLKFMVPFGASVSLPHATSAAAESSLTVFIVPSGATDRAIPWREVLVFAWAAGVVAIALRRFSKHRALVRALGQTIAPPQRVCELAQQLGVRAPVVVHVPSSAQLDSASDRSSSHAAASRGSSTQSTHTAASDATSSHGSSTQSTHTAASDAASSHGSSTQRTHTAAALHGAPCLVGVWRPVLVLPAEASGVEFDAMVVHELMHLRRRDPLWRALQAVVETLFFFWPVVRLASRQLSLAREEACDLAVVESGVIGRARYAEVLLQLGLETSPSLAMAAQPSHLERRIQMVLSGKKLRPMWLAVVVVAFAGLAGASASVFSPDPMSVVHDVPSFVAQPAPVRLSINGGSIDERVLTTQMLTDRSVIDACYFDYLRDHPGVSGAVLLHFTVKTDGSVVGQCQEEGTTLPIEVGRCISERLELMRLPRPLGTEDVELRYRFEFVAPPSEAQPSGTPT